jgi:hypothetical protein
MHLQAKGCRLGPRRPLEDDGDAVVSRICFGRMKRDPSGGAWNGDGVAARLRTVL